MHTDPKAFSLTVDNRNVDIKYLAKRFETFFVGYPYNNNKNNIY